MTERGEGRLWLVIAVAFTYLVLLFHLLIRFCYSAYLSCLCLSVLPLLICLGLTIFLGFFLGYLGFLGFPGFPGFPGCLALP